MIQMIITLFMSPIAVAGGWSSGGGGLLKDTVNPWFLNNTPSVSYCIVIDQKNFGASQDVAKLQLTSALQFWKEQFSNAVLQNLPKFGPLKIASQIFTETTCGSDPDIVFQFGVLSDKQKKFLKEPTEYAAISVRTNYDERNLRSKGFVYVSPSAGPLAYNLEGVVKDAWNMDGGHLLYLTLLHELGHVFGLQHMGSYGDLMSEGFVEAILASATNIKISPAEEFHFFTLPKVSRISCFSDVMLETWQKYFGAKMSDKCFQIVFSHNQKNELFGKTLMKVYAASSTSEQLKEIQSIEFSMNSFFPTFTSLIWLSSKQAVFETSDLQKTINSGILGISAVAIGKQGQFVLSDGKTERSIKVRFEQGRMQFFIDGVLDGKIVQIL